MCPVWCAQAGACGKDLIFLSTLRHHLPKLWENKRNQLPYICRELLFRQRSSGGGDVKLTYNKLSITLKSNELNYLLANIAVIENQLVRHTAAQPDAISYVTAATGAKTFVQPRPDVSGYALYDVLLNELKGYLWHNHCSERKLCKVLSLVIFILVTYSHESSGSLCKCPLPSYCISNSLSLVKC